MEYLKILETMTQFQQQAANPDFSVWVAASAGTGKTKVLTDRVLRILLNGTTPGKILCITFTKAAAAEMANRINTELGKWVYMEENELISSIENLTGKRPNNEIINLARRLFAIVLDTPDGIKIQTIHSFCQNMMRKFPLEAGIAPHFQVIDDYTSAELLDEARTRLLTNNEDIKITNSIERIACWLNEGRFSELIKKVMSERGKIKFYTKQYGSIENFIDKIYENLNLTKGLTEAEIIRSHIENNHLFFEELKNISQALKINTKSIGDNKTSRHLLKFYNYNINDKIDNFEEYTQIFLTADNEPRKSLATKIFSEKYPEFHELLIAEQNRIFALLDKMKSARIANLSADLMNVSESIIELYSKLKKQKAFLDYDDLITSSSELLTKSDIAPWILFKLDGGIDHLLLDEAQDTSPEQWQIINRLCEEFFTGQSARNNDRTIFIVGDEKQSIYSFQGADPKTFNKMHEFFAEKVQSSQKIWHSIALDTSFRSSPPVLNVVDDIFSDDEIKKSITFSPELIKHNADRLNDYGRVELWPLIEEEKKDEITPWEIPSSMKHGNKPLKKLAETIIVEIKSWLESGRFLHGQKRKIKPSDIMILVKKRNELIDYLVKGLKRENIPVSGVDRMVLTEHIAVEDLISLGKFLLLPDDNLNLAALLKTPFIGLSEEELFNIAYNRSDKTLWQSLKNNNNICYENAKIFLDDLLKKVDFLTPFEIFSYVLETLDGRKKLASRLGDEINDPVDEFISAAIDYENSHTPSMQGFIHWINSGEQQIKRDLEQSANEIRIMTVHGSKGLQSPIVILPDSTETPTSVSKMQSIFWVDGKNPVLLWPAISANDNNLIKNIKSSLNKNEMDEYLRLLYVAMTRAKDELYVMGYEKNKDKKTSWYNLIKNSLQKIGREENGKLILENFTPEETFIENIKDNKTEYQLPEFAFSKAPDEPVPSKPLTPSKIDGDEQDGLSPLISEAMLRGKIIHKILEYLPEIDKEKRFEAGTRFLKKYANELHDNERAEILKNVIELTERDDLQFIFSKNSKAEVPVTGVIDNYVISGRIDRIAITDNEVIIVDYKTNRKTPKNNDEIDKSYIRQMDLYRKALLNIYPDKNVRCFLIWTNEIKVIEISKEALKEKAA